MADLRDDARVALCKEAPRYAQTAPFAPSDAFPEWPGVTPGAEDNPAYRAVRQLFYHLRLDSAHYGTPEWNPLRALIEPGDAVLLKPNFVSDHNLGDGTPHLSDTDSLITHGSVIRVVLDYVAKALQGRGRIIIGDCPVQGSDWEKLIHVAGLDSIETYFRGAFPGIDLAIHDYRLGRAVVHNDMVVERIVDDARLGEYYEIDLGVQSELLPLMHVPYEFGVSQYPRKRMRNAHTPQTNKYLIHRDFIHADVLINLPKMKSHMKAGITCSMKNLVGLVGHKDYLPHFRFGSPKQGGDEYPDGNPLWDLMWRCYHADWERDKGMAKRAYLLAGSLLAKVVRRLPYGQPLDPTLGGGSWHGNDTVWRTLLDINRAFFYFDREQRRVSARLSPDVRYLAILDGLIGGQKESPLSPTPVESGVMLAAHNPLALDTVAAAMMGLDVRKIKQVTRGFALRTLPLAHFSPDQIVICGNVPATGVKDIYERRIYTAFEPSRGFLGALEYRHTDMTGRLRQSAAPPGEGGIQHRHDARSRAPDGLARPHGEEPVTDGAGGRAAGQRSKRPRAPNFRGHER